MVQTRMTQEITDRAGHPSFFIPCAEDHPLHTRQHDRTRAHGAWFQCYIEGTVVESPAIEFGGRLANREELGVSGRVLIADSAICCCCDDCPVPNYDCTNGNFVALPRIAGEVESVSNVLLVGSERLRADVRSLCARAVICLQAPARSPS